MKPFLLELAEKIINKQLPLNVHTLVFPNRRAALYFRKHLSSLITKPAFSPRLITIEDFIAQFSTWIHRVAVNIVLTDRKNEARARKRTVEDEAENGGETPLQKASVTPGWGDRMDITAAMEMLPRGARQIFVLHDIEGYKHEEIAEMCGITAGGSKAQLHRARLLLREALTR